MSVVAETADGTECVVSLEGVAGVADLLEAVYTALGLDQWEQFEAVLRDGEGWETVLEPDEERGLGDLGIYGCEERVFVRARGRYIAREKLRDLGVVTKDDCREALRQWLEEDTDVSREGLRLLAGAKGFRRVLESALLHAVKSGKTGRVAKLLAAGVDSRDPSLLRAAIQLWVNSTAITKLLLQHGADANSATSSGRTAMFHAIDMKNTAMVSLLLEHGADATKGHTDQWTTPLMRAVKKNWQWGAKLLLEHGVDVNAVDVKGRTALHILLDAFFDTDDLKALKLLLDHGTDANIADAKGVTALMLAAKRGSERTLGLLVEGGARLDTVDRRGRTALRYAVDHSFAESQCVPDLSMVVPLLELGADANVADASGVTVLMRAAGGGLGYLFAPLVAHGARLDDVDRRGYTALAHAVHYDGAPADEDNSLDSAPPPDNLAQTDMVETLLELGANPNIPDAKGRTPLMIAAKSVAKVGPEAEPLVCALLAGGADIQVRDRAGRTAMSYADGRDSEWWVRRVLQGKGGPGA